MTTEQQERFIYACQDLQIKADHAVALLIATFGVDAVNSMEFVLSSTRFSESVVSNCCGSRIKYSDICAKCDEHCAPVVVE